MGGGASTTAPSGAEPARIRELYRARAAAYDRVSALYRLFGFHHPRYRERAVASLGLRPGATVVDLACGTGLNFGALQRAVGPGGRIVGVDLTDAMLDAARARVRRRGWTNVALVEADMADFEYAGPVDAVLCTLALSLSPDYDTVVRRAAAALAPSRRMAVLDLRFPERWPGWAVKLGVRLNRGYGVDLSLRARTPWTSVRAHLSEVEYAQFFGGALYLLTAESTSSSRTRAQPSRGA